MRARRRRLAFLASLSLAASCDRAADPEADRELVVFAASSLEGSFDELEGRFEAAHRGVDVRCQYAGSQALEAQIAHGADADVFASADAPHVEALARLGLVAGETRFAANELAIAVPLGQGARFRSAADLRGAERVVVGAADVPVGAYTARFLARGDAVFGAGFSEDVRAHVVSREANVRLVLAKVALGEADAAVVYATDALAAAERVDAVRIPPEANVRAEYTAAVLRDAREPALAREWVELLLSAEGRRVLEARGFAVDRAEDEAR